MQVGAAVETAPLWRRAGRRVGPSRTNFHSGFFVTSRKAAQTWWNTGMSSSAHTDPVELIAQQYDQLINYATAIRAGTASTEAILRRFTRAATHPTYQAMLEVGRAQKTIFLCRYLRDRDLQREINSGLNVAESWNRANAEIFYGKARDIASNRRDEQEMSVLCLHILQAAMVYVNTLMLQDVLAEGYSNRPSETMSFLPAISHHRRARKPDGMLGGPRKRQWEG